MKVSDVLGRYKPAERTVRLLLDGSLVAELDRARKAVRDAVREEARNPQGLRTTVPDLEAKVAELERRADGATVEFTIRAVSGAKYDALKQAFPPTEAQWAEYREEAKASPMFARPPTVDADALAPALVGLSIVAVDGEEVDWDEADGAELWGTLHDGARADLLDAVWEVNGQRGARPFSGTGTDTTPSSGPESTTPASTESH
jgi:hypothetical protein